jgi:hypothetical protein
VIFMKLMEDFNEVKNMPKRIKAKEDIDRLNVLKAERKSMLDDRKSIKIHLKENNNERHTILAKYKKV